MAEEGWIRAGRLELSSGFSSLQLPPGVASAGTISPLKPRVLVVEEAASPESCIAGELSARGYQVGMATSAADALETARSGFEVALVRLRKPDQPGLRVVAALKQACPPGKVVLLAGYATLGTVPALLRLGAFACLFMPCPSAKLLRTIDLALVSSRQRSRGPLQGELVWPPERESDL